MVSLFLLLHWLVERRSAAISHTILLLYVSSPEGSTNFKSLVLTLKITASGPLTSVGVGEEHGCKRDHLQKSSEQTKAA